MLISVLEFLHAELGDFLVKVQVAEGEMSDAASPPEYVETIKARLRGKIDGFISALEALKGSI